MVNPSPSDEVATIERQMQYARETLEQATAACRREKRRWTDWRTHVQAHPWAACALAAAAGALVAPRLGRRPPPPSPAAPENVATAGRQGRSESVFNQVASDLARKALQQALATGAVWALNQFHAQREAAAARHTVSDQQAATSISPE